MADPISIAAVVGMGTTAAGSIMGAFGAKEAGQAQSNMYQYQAGVAKINQQIAEQNADYAIRAGDVEAQQSGMKTRFTVGSEKVAQAASGLDVNTGSAGLVRESEQELGAFDQAQIRASAARRAYGYEVEGLQQSAQGTIDTYAADQAKKAGDIGAISSILGGASSVSSKWIQAKTSGIPGFA